MKKKLENYEGQFKEIQPAASPSYIQSESLSERSGLFNWEISPHLHTHLLQIFYIENGSVRVEMTKGSYELKAPGIMIIPPGSVHGFSYDPLIKGHVISIGEVYLEELLQSDARLLLNLKNIEFITEFDEEISFDYLLNINLQINKELFGDFKERQLALKALLSLSFLKLHRLLERNYSSVNKQNLNESHYYTFQKSFKNTLPFTKTIPDYAAELNISPVHLNRICQAATGRSASWILQEYAVLEAQKLMIFTSCSLSEIAYQLNFSDPAYFSRLFRKHIGITPGKYRKR